MPNDVFDPDEELRRLAEKQVGPQQYGAQALSASEVFKALHELRVHQVELEMQNEELRRTQIELTESRSRYQELFDFAPVGYLSLDEEGRIVEANLTAATMLREPRSSLVGRYASGFIATEHGDAFHLYRQRRLASPTPIVLSAEFRLAHEDNSAFWVRLDATLAESDSGMRLTRLTMGDISRLIIADEVIRRDAQAISVASESLRLQSALMRETGALAHIGSWHVGADYSERVWSEEMYRIFDLSPTVTGAELDLAVRQAVRHGGQDGLRDIDLALGLDGVPEAKDYRIETPGGQLRWVHVEGEAQHDADGHLMTSNGFLQDITRRKQSETYRDMTRDVLQALNEPSGFRDTALRILAVLKSHLAVDAAAIRLMSGKDCPYHVHIGLSEAFLAAENSLLAPSAGASADKDTDVRLKGTCGLVLSGRADRSHPNITPGGSYHWSGPQVRVALRAEDGSPYELCDGCAAEGYASIALIPIRDSHGVIGLLQLVDRRPGQFTVDAIEVLESIASHMGAAFTRMQAEVRLAAAVEDLERSNRELESFAYVASHDLKEPLRMVSSYTALLKQRYEGQLDSDADDYIGFAVSGAARMQLLLEDLLEYSRVGTRGKDPAPVSSQHAIEMALANLDTTLRETEAQVSVGDLPDVMADEPQLMRVFQNLIDNALKFRRPEDVPRISVSASREGDMVRFRVADQGIGIAGSGFDQVFEVSRRMVGRDEYPGTGIGLAICRRIVERQGGTIWVDSSDEGGTAFCFTLPAVD